MVKYILLLVNIAMVVQSVCVGGDEGVATRSGDGVQVDRGQRVERLCKPCKHLCNCMSNHTNCNVTILLTNADILVLVYITLIY